jgi:hypothetical protein
MKKIRSKTLEAIISRMMASDFLFSSPSTRVTELENACEQENSNDQQG